MQRLTHRCPRCDQPLGISWDMWGKYYLCGGIPAKAEKGSSFSPNPSANLVGR